MQFNRLILILILLAFGCSDPGYLGSGSPEASQEVVADSLQLYANEGLVYYQGAPFSGISVAYYPDGTKAVSIEYSEGKKEGKEYRWFENSLLSYEANYSQGKKNGASHTWWRNGQMRSSSHFKEGIANGTQRQWYASGAKFKVIQIQDGKELGLQQSWRENGKIYNNYEVKDGRIFGLKRSKLCFQLKDGELADL
ncbi:hypothetical protein GCM10007049_37980 [Echinicola pacifica]|uniref:MORN repeat variant n=1 Tax=Echinicola pacifica TaxID=346377 RepID=A0A918QEV2_9BACT|nr:toxin-antitoxin system YwqK family antitoxin [Echinicola pacifica]GGZ41062.1 hypothetical protein GCM10007049_37980 [Echinicola pacifica]